MKGFSIFVILILLTNIVYSEIYEQEFESEEIARGAENAQFRILTMKYEPYPVNPGDYFDIWIKVENIGNKVAENAKFVLVADYPFSSNEELVREYGKISGYAKREEEENFVVLKYRLKVDEFAAEGQNDLEFRTSVGSIGSKSEIIKKLKIEVANTKTDFDVVMQDSSQQGTSLAIANIGENAATAVTIRIKEQEGFNVRGPQASVVGNLDKGDFTTVGFQLIPEKDSKDLFVEIAYTDIAGVRNILEKVIEVDITKPTDISELVRSGGRQGSDNSSNWLYITGGFIAGIIGMLLFNRLKRKKT